MGSVGMELSKKRGERVKELLRENKMYQSALSDIIGFTPEHLNAVLNGKRTMTLETARAISKVFPPVRYEWILCFDDFKTENDKFNSTLEESWENAKVLDDLLRRLAKSMHYELKIVDPETTDTKDVDLGGLCYVVLENRTVIACISLEDYFCIRHEIAHYSSYLFKNLVDRKKQFLPNTFELPKEG